MRGFLDDYMDYVSEQESPDSFHMWTGITIAGTALGRKCYVDKRFYRLYPNLFVLLIAGSARCRKSTALYQGVNLLRSIGGPTIINGKITPEGFLKELDLAQSLPPAYVPPTLVHSSELAVFLTKQQHGEPLIHILTDLFDCPGQWEYKTKNSGNNILRDVFLSILAATTPRGLGNSIPINAIEEGFGSRVIFVFEGVPGKINDLVSDDNPPPPPDSFPASYGLKQISQMSGEFKLDDAARVWYRDWYYVYMNTEAPDKRLEGMYGRKHDHLLRLGMIMAACYGQMTIEVDHLEAALMQLNDAELKAPYAFTHMGGDQVTDLTTNARVVISKFRRLSRSEFLRRLQPCSAETFRKILDTLLEEGFVKRDPTNPIVYQVAEEIPMAGSSEDKEFSDRLHSVLDMTNSDEETF